MLGNNDLTISLQDMFNYGVPALVLVVGGMLRSYMIDGLRRLRFLMGFITLFAKVAKDLQPVMNKIDVDKLTEPTRSVVMKLRPFVESTAVLVDSLLASPPESHKQISESLLIEIEKMIQSRSGEHPVLLKGESK